VAASFARTLLPLREQKSSLCVRVVFRACLWPGGKRFFYSLVSDHHQPYIKAVASAVPRARHVRAGLHRARGETTKPIERSHVATRDRLRGARGLKTVATGQRFLECFEGLHALRRGDVKLRALVPKYQPTKASPHETTRAVMIAVNALGVQLKKAA
jgi:hypothetical protein